MRELIVSLMLLIFFYSSYAQSDTLGERRIYKAWISHQSGKNQTSGFLYDVEDSSIMVANRSKRDFYDFTTIEYGDIGTIGLRNKNSTINRILIGSFSGMVAGAIIGYAQGDDPPCDFICIFNWTARDKAIIGGATGIFGGAVIGAVTGPVRINIPIKGDIHNFNKQKSRLKRYSYTL